MGEPILDAEDAVDKFIEPINKPFEGIEKEIEKDADTLTEDIFPGAKDFVEDGDTEWYEYFGYFRWIINFLFVGVPWFFWSIVLCIFNLVWNMVLNDFWADGNFLLVFNTWYLLLQTVMSWPLIFEIPFYMEHLRFFRTFSVTWAYIYMLFYMFIVSDWVFQLYLEPE